MAASIAYTSSAPMVFTPPTPPVGLSDVVIDLNGGSLGTSPDVYGAGLDPGDNAATFTYVWSLVDRPAGSVAALTSSTSAHTTFGPIDVWGNYRLMLVVTSSGVGGASEANILKAPATAFLTVRVKEALYGLQKPARFEREWQVPVREYADDIVAVRTQLDGTRVQDLAGVVAALATSTNLNKLFDNSSVGGYHRHTSADLPKAGAAAFGIVETSDSPLDGSNPQALNRDRISLTAFVDGTPTEAGYAAGIVTVPITRAGTTGIRPACLFYVKEAWTLLRLSLALADGGLSSGTDYAFALYSGTATQWKTGTPTVIASTAVTGAAATDNAPLLLDSGAIEEALTADTWLGLVCTAAPDPAGGQMTVTATVERRV